VTGAMEDNQPQALRVGDWLVYPLEGKLDRDRETVRIEPKAIELLVYAVRAAFLIRFVIDCRELWLRVCRFISYNGEAIDSPNCSRMGATQGIWRPFRRARAALVVRSMHM